MVPLWLMRRTCEESNGTAALVVFIALHRWIDADKECHPSVGSIAREAGISEATVRRGLKLLEDIGAITSEPRWTDDGDRTSNLYHLRYVEPASNRDTTPSQDCDHPPSQIRQDPPSQICEGKKIHVEGEPVEEELAHASVSTTDDARLSFEHWWSAYPRKVGKGAALKRWKAISRQQRADAVDALPRHVEHWRLSRTEVQFIPHPATWLSQGRWDDVLITEQRQPSAPSAALYAAERFRQAQERERPQPRPTLMLDAGDEWWED
jgi:hypothetical protein